MKKQTLLFLLVTIFALTPLSACKPTPSPTSAPSNPVSLPSPQEEITVVPTEAIKSSGRPYLGPDVIIQEGNSFQAFQLLTRRSIELADNRIGFAFAGPGLVIDLWQLSHVLDHHADNGVKVIHSSMYEIEPPIDWSNDEYNVPPEFDQFVDDINENGVAFNYIVSFWDKAAHANGETLSVPRFTTEEQIQEFLEYVQFIVGHFKGRVQYYTIWNEPDNCGGSGINCIRPNDYIELIKRVVPIIHEADPQAKVAIAGNVLYHARENLFAVLESDAMPLVDVVQWHGLYDVLPNDDELSGNYYYEYPSLIEEIKQTAAANGFNGEYWSTEVTWCSDSFPNCKPGDQDGEQAETDFLAAKYYLRGILMHLGMDVGISLGGFQTSASWSFPAIRNISTVMAGATPTNLTVNVDSESTNILSYAFTLPNSDGLLAIWTNGVAVSADPGISTTLTFPDQSAQQAVIIDPLYGFEQELNTAMENGNLIIRNLLVKDYPIIIKLINASYVDIPEQTPEITPTTEFVPVLSLTGTWQGNDPTDNSETGLFLTQTGDQLEGTFSDSFSEKPDGTLIQPGFSGQGLGYFVSSTEAMMFFDLTRSDGERIQLNMRLIISLQDSTLTLEIPQQSSPFILNRQE